MKRLGSECFTMHDAEPVTSAMDLNWKKYLHILQATLLPRHNDLQDKPPDHR